MINKIIGSYRITKKLGEGGMGSVYLANHVNIETKVAIKILHKHLISNNTIRTRFLKEAKMQAILDHPNITKVIDFIDNKDGLFIILEFIEGEELNDYLFKNKGLMPESEANFYMSKILDAVAYAHSKGIIHRDLKSANIMITPNRDIKIMDFGIAKLVGDSLSLTKTGSRIGSPLYMSPEQVTSGIIDFRSDIYSLGVVYHEMLTGKPIYDQNNTTEYEIYDKIVRQPLPRLKTYYPLISDKAQEIVDRATSKLPQGRYQKCEEFKQAINNKTTAYIPKISKKKSSNGTLKVFVVLLLLGLIGTGVWFFLNQDKTKTNPIVENNLVKAVNSENNKDYKNALITYENILQKKPNNIEILQRIKELKEKSLKYKEKKINTILITYLQTNNLDTIKSSDILLVKKLESNYQEIIKSIDSLKIDKQIVNLDFSIIKKLDSLKNKIITIKKENVVLGETIPFDFVEKVPSFKDCNYKGNNNQKKCFDKKIQRYLTSNINTKLYNNLGLSNGKKTIKYLFVIDSEGKIRNIKINAPHTSIEQDIKNILKTLSNFKAGKDNNKAVAVTYASTFDINIGKIHPKENQPVVQIENNYDNREIIVPSSVSFHEAERAPVFPGCESESNSRMRRCTSNKILNYILTNIKYDKIKEGKAYEELIKVRFQVTKTGGVSNINIKTNRESIKKEIIRVINALPNMQPAIFESDLPVAANFTGTVNIKVTMK
jgi:serine/threonine protein kinase